MEQLIAAIISYVAYYKTQKGEYFYDVCCRDMDGWYHNLLFRPEKMKEIRKEWSVKDVPHCLGRLVLLSGIKGGCVATLLKTKSYNLGHHNDNNIYSLVESELLWGLGENGI